MFSKIKKYHFNPLTITAVLLFFVCFQFSVKAQNSAWQPASFEVVKSNYKTFKTIQYAHVFSGSKHNIVKLAPELQGLTGVELPLSTYKNGTNTPLQLKFKEPVQVLIGVFNENNSEYLQADKLQNAKL